MPTCKYERGDYKCEHDSGATTSDGFCILHSPLSWKQSGSALILGKDENAFKQALAAHREKHGDIFIGFVFPAAFTFKAAEFSGDASFWHAEFSGDASFGDAKFSGDADFESAKFGGKAGFWGAEFSGKARFAFAEFSGDASFPSSKFSGDASFWSSKFSGKANFRSSKFSGDADFGSAEFSRDTDFGSAEFSGKTNFSESKFLSRTLFISRKRDDKIIQIFCLTEPEADIDFTDVIIEPPDAIIFRDADLTKCRFLGTDLRKAEITNAIWPQIGSRAGVYDEIATLAEGETRQWSHIERVYRELKQNYEDRRDYERARDFHYGEKEMRRKNPKASRGLRFLLTLYWAVSGYGERLLRPLLWAVGVLVVSTSCYLWWGLLHFKAKGPISDPVLHWWDATFYGLRVMTLLKPDNLQPARLWGDFINIAQSFLGPVLLGLFALALRQRLKR